MAKKVQYTTNQPSSTTDYLAADNTWKPISGGGGGVPTTRTLTINGSTQDLSANRTWSVGDMLTSVYDTDADGVVDKAERIEIVVRNSTGSTLTKGQIVYLSGATGNRPNALLAKADAEATSSKTIGMVTVDIPNNTDGNIAVNGTLHDIDTHSFTAGDSLWLSATTAGGVVANTPPAEPNHAVFIGYVARSHPTLGRVVLEVQNGYELDELHGVQITSVANNDVLKYNSTSGLWENSNVLSTKQDTITGGASSIVSSNLTTYRALVSDGGGKVAVSGVSGTELGYLSGVTSNIQSQLNAKASTSKSLLYANYGLSTVAASSTAYTGFINSVFTTSVVNEWKYYIIFPVNCIVNNFVISKNASPAGGTLVFTIRKNGVDTALIITCAAGSATGNYFNTTTSVSFSAGDFISYKIVNNAPATSGAIVQSSIVVEI